MNQRKIIEYIIVSDSDVAILVDKINGMLAMNWELFGAPFSDGEYNHKTREECCIHQAMVKYEEPK